MDIGSGQGLNRLFDGSQGQQVNRMLDSLGLPDAVGDLIGAQVDSQRGDIAGMQRNLQDLYSDLKTSDMDKLFGRGLPPSGFLPRPSLNPFQGMTETPMGFRPLGMSKEAPFGTGFVGRSMENAINQNPFFKAQMERVLGGTIIPDARTDGRLTVYRSPFNQIGSLMQNAFAGGLPQQGLAGILGGLNLPFGPSFMGSDLSRSVLGGLQRMEGNIASFMQGLPQSPFEGTMLNQLQNFPFPGSILGGPIGGLIGELQNNNSYNPLLDNLGQSFQIMGNMMQAAAYGDMRFLTNFRA